MSGLYKQLCEIAQNQPEKLAIIEEKKSISYAQLLEKVDFWALAISAKHNGCIRAALLSDSLIEAAVISFAIAKINGVCIPTNAQMTAEQLCQGWAAVDTNLVLYSAKYRNKTKILNDQYQCLEINLESQAIYCSEMPESKIADSEYGDDFLITLSSGSTGDPKPIVISQQVKSLRALQTKELYQLTDQDVVLCASPFFHSLGQRLLFVPLLAGATVVQLVHFNPQKWLAMVSEHKVSFVISVSSHLYALRSFLVSAKDQLQSLNTIVTSSAPIDADFKQQIFKTINCQFFEIYGATEIAIASNLTPEHAQTKFSTVGSVCEGVDIKVVNEQFEQLANGCIGQIAVNTPLAFDGYYKKPELTHQSFTSDGYFLTGDLGFIDEEGFLSYLSRAKDMIICGGINVYPIDIEKVIAKHALVLEVAVFGINDDLLGEVVGAACVLKGSSEELNIEFELVQHCRKSLASYQRPLKFFFLEALPLTDTGKVSKKELKQQYGDPSDSLTKALESTFNIN